MRAGSLVSKLKRHPILGLVIATVVSAFAFQSALATGFMNLGAMWKVSNGPRMLGDFNAGIRGGMDLGQGVLTPIGSYLYFSGHDGVHGFELMRTDGTLAGTTLVKDINPTSHSIPLGFAEVGANILFWANDGTNGYELWKTDGTSGGTVLIKDINPGASDSVHLLNNSLGNRPIQVVMGGVLYFIADDGTNGTELWKSDGTAVGTTMVIDYNNLGNSSATTLVEMGGVLYYDPVDSSGLQTLVKSDGTAGGTAVVKGGGGPTGVYYLTKFGAKLYFGGNDAINGYELWVSDGTSGGTSMLKDIAAGLSGTEVPKPIGNIGTTILFYAEDGAGNQCALWKTDGTTVGTVMVKQVNDLGYCVNANGVTVGGTFYFTEMTVADGTALWKSDGTTGGTTLVKNVGGSGIVNSYFDPIRVVGTTMFFAVSGATGWTLWKSDGTSGGTVSVKTIWTNQSNSFTPIQEFAGEGYFAAIDGSSGAGIWKTDGTTGGTVLVSSVDYVRTLDAFPDISIWASVDGTFFFTQTATGFLGSSLWKTDGTTAGTSMLADLQPSDAVSPEYSFASDNVLGSTLIFVGVDAANGAELWKTDGTIAGTVLVKDIKAGAASCFSSGFSAGKLNSTTLLFIGDDGAAEKELWKTDGTTAGTVLVKDIRSGAAGSFVYPTDFVVNGSIAVFSADDGTNGHELWKTDGTTAGTVMVKNINPSGDANVFYHTPFGSGFLINADDGTNGSELWITDGTTGGTTMLKDINPTGPSFPTGFIVLGSVAFFQADDGTNGVELWKTDGTPAGTVMVKDINVGVGSASYPYRFAVTSNTLYFTAYDGTASYLWKSDGTGAGTVAIGTTLFTNPNNITAVGELVYFTADTTNNKGTELWRTDGTEAGTRLVKDINPGGGSGFDGSGGVPFPVIGNRIYFPANNGVHGIELWAYP